MRLLVVEDDAKIASFVVRGLREAGFAVDHAPDGEQGLLLAETTDYDAAVVDVMLPRLDGISLVRRLRAGRRPMMPVLFLSAKAGVGACGRPAGRNVPPECSLPRVPAPRTRHGPGR